MPVPRSLGQPLRQGQIPVGSGWRAYCAPYNRQLQVQTGDTSQGPTIYDLIASGRFLDTSLNPLGNWYDLGYVRNFKFTPQTKRGNIITGYRGVIRAKYMAETGEKFSMSFEEMSRTTQKFATGTQVFNLLKTTVVTPSTVGPMSTSGTAAVAMGASGYLASGHAGQTSGLPTLYVPAGSGSLFPAGSMIVCDQDYDTGTLPYGSVGDSGANLLYSGATTDVDFIRRTSDYVATVAKVIANEVTGQDALILTEPFVGGGNAPLGSSPNYGPTAGAKVQAIAGWASREGGSKIEEWSALMVLDTIDGTQILHYYPRVSPDANNGMPGTNLQNATAMQSYGQEASFDCLAFDDPLDGETVVAYRACFPHPNFNAQI